jgi:hypothetical protein
MIDDPQQDLLGLEGLGDVVDPASGETRRLVVDHGLGGEKDDRYILGFSVGLERPAQGESVAIGQHHVQQDQVWAKGPRIAQSDGRVRGAGQFQRIGAHHLQQDAQAVRLIVDDQDAVLGLARTGAG